MDLKRKLELTESAITSISRHDDEDAAVRHAALDRVVQMIERERAGIDQRVKERTASMLGDAPAGPAAG